VVSESRVYVPREQGSRIPTHIIPRGHPAKRQFLALSRLRRVTEYSRFNWGISG
jgi:hypothetical protein